MNDIVVHDLNTFSNIGFMEITNIKIDNYKSIDHIEFDITRHGPSYTTMLLGVNESGKSNILKAMSFLDTPSETFDYNVIHNQKDDSGRPVMVTFGLAFEMEDTYLNAVRENVVQGQLLHFRLVNIQKQVWLEDGETEFSEGYSFEVEDLSEGLYIKKTAKTETVNGQPKSVTTITLAKENDEESTYTELNEEVFLEHFEAKIFALIKQYENKVSFWKPSEKYLLSEVNLNEFKEDINSNIPLKHIFYIAGFKDAAVIKKQIEKIEDSSLRRRLASTLGDKATAYIKKIWNHKITIDIEILESGVCNVSVKDDGKKNEHNFHKMNVRSEGFKQFISLILSLSIETRETNAKNKLILIDEPESHLHPSGIRDLREELLEIGKDNYLFVSTHSPFLVDRLHKERNIVIKKSNDALTEKKHIENHEDLRSDEVLDIAFGLNVYKDLLAPHRILVEGASDKKILEKAFSLLGYEYGITNGIGSNVVQVASRLNHDDISVLVVLDDDESGKDCKDKITKIKGVYSSKNVLTIRDLEAGIKNDGTIEDVLNKAFVQSKFEELFNKEFGQQPTLTLNDDPYVNQIKIHLQQEGHQSDAFLEKFKTKLAEELNIRKAALENDFPLLKALAEAVNAKLES